MNTTPATYELVIERGPQPGQTFSLSLPSHTIGRDPISDICISDPEVSRQHGLLIQGPSGGYRIQDLGSTNGTVVDGKRLAGDAHSLQPGQVITLGGSVALRYREKVSPQNQAASAGLELEKEVASAVAPVINTDPERLRQEVLAGANDAVGAESAHSNAPEEESVTAQDSAEWLRRAPVRAEMPAAQEVPREPNRDERLAPSDDGDEADGQVDPGRRLLSIALGILLILLCVCCSMTVFMYYVGGDWLLREMGVVP